MFMLGRDKNKKSLAENKYCQHILSLINLGQMMII
jgi:hypothetical protein